MEAGITTEFEITRFAGLETRILNPYPSHFTILDMTVTPGFGAPAHVSYSADKLFIVLEGELRFLIDAKTENVVPGARVMVPRGTIHGFTNVGSGPARQLLIASPRRHEEFFRDLHNIPKPRESHMDQLPEIARRNGQVITGPLP